MISRRIFFEGRVQGVGFRWSVRELATGFDLAGTIRNLPDGRVELCLRGHPEEIDGLLLAIADSHLAAHITHRVTEEWTDVPASLRGFSIVT
jgi:acylphosphatase